MRVCKLRAKSLDEKVEDPRGFLPIVSDSEWRIVLGSSELNQQDLIEKQPLNF